MISYDRSKFVNDGIITKSLAVRYLNTYIGQLDWETHLNRVFKRLERDYGKELATEKMREIIACTLLLPQIEGLHHIAEADKARLLYTVKSYRQFSERNWSEMLRKIVARDLEIERWRQQALDLGIIDPIDYQPLCREAFNRLYNAAYEAGYITSDTKEYVSNSAKVLVWAYGGTVVTNVFTTNEKALGKVLDWRTGYFFERAIYETYTIDQILKIKKQELNKTNEHLIHRRKIKVGE